MVLHVCCTLQALLDGERYVALGGLARVGCICVLFDDSAQMVKRHIRWRRTDLPCRQHANVIADNTHIGLPTAAVAVLPIVTSDDARCLAEQLRDTRPSGTSVRAHGAQSACGSNRVPNGYSHSALCSYTVPKLYLHGSLHTTARACAPVLLREGEGVTHRRR